MALAFAGADANANNLSIEAINDPALTLNHRSNLVENLDEDGVANARNLRADDLPLIDSRIELIEQLAPRAMGEVNLAAFKEACKDSRTGARRRPESRFLLVSGPAPPTTCFGATRLIRLMDSLRQAV